MYIYIYTNRFVGTQPNSDHPDADCCREDLRSHLTRHGDLNGLYAKQSKKRLRSVEKISGIPSGKR